MPGLVPSRLPGSFELFKAEKDLSARKDLYAHNVKLSNMKEVEHAFNQFLRQLCISEEQPQNPKQPIRASICERKLAISAHNTWTQLGHASLISLSKDSNGEVHTTGSVKILDFVLHPSVSLIFKLTYRGKSFVVVQLYSYD